MLVDEKAEYIPLRLWLDGKEIEESIIDFKIGIENDLEQLSNLLGVDLVLMVITPKKVIETS